MKRQVERKKARGSGEGRSVAGRHPGEAAIRAGLARVTSQLYDRGLVTGSGGNLSARDPRTPGRVWITPAGEFKGGLRPASMIAVDLNGEPLSRSRSRPSSDVQFHCSIYRRRPEVNAIVHTHAPQALQLALTGTRFLPISTEAAIVGEIPIVPFIQPGTAELAEAVAVALAGGAALLMQNHGLVVAAGDLGRAAALTETIEATAGALLTCRAMGIGPAVLSAEQVREARKKGHHSA